MHFSALTVLLGFAAVSLAAPTGSSCISPAVPVLKEQSYNEISVSAGVAGNALAEVQAKFPIDVNNLALVAFSDLRIIAKASQIGEQAESAPGGFNDAIAAAGGQSTVAGKALQNGKIKNKVLKLQTDVWRIMIEMAQGEMRSAGDLERQKTKLAKNVALDEAAKGQAATAINFEARD